MAEAPAEAAARAAARAAREALGAYERASRAANPPVRAQVLAFPPAQLAELFPGPLGEALLAPLAWPDPCGGAPAFRARREGGPGGRPAGRPRRGGGPAGGGSGGSSR
jgi:hypothetical protein